MAVLHITYKRDPDTSDADYECFCMVLNTYGYVRLSESNWAIYTDEPAKAVWQKLKRYIDPDGYLVMFPLDAHLLTSQDRKVVQWILARP